MFSMPALNVLVSRLVFLLIGAPIHEWAHAWSAYELGDDTASMAGRLTLNPLAHLDAIGTILILLTGFGWAKPVPVNPYRMRVEARTGMAISAFAGPVSNFLLAMICAIPFRLGLLSYADPRLLPQMLVEIASVSLGLGLFNLLPIYPLDGEKVLMGLLPREMGDMLLSLRPFSPYILMGVIGLGIASTLIGIIFRPIWMALFF
ncbi:MAG: site-2 protease family protein [Anaerolineae bacterium]|nr:site-2 protease family protein [Anaerolineae bacterium]